MELFMYYDNNNIIMISSKRTHKKIKDRPLKILLTQAVCDIHKREYKMSWHKQGNAWSSPWYNYYVNFTS